MFTGTITRSTEVRPELISGVFRCLMCNTLIRGIKQQHKYTTPIICANPSCDNRSEWHLDIQESSFSDF